MVKVFGTISLLMFSCATTTLTPLSLAPQLLQDPPIGEQRTANLGDTLVSTSRLVRIPAIQLTEAIDEDTSFMKMTSRLTIPSGTFPARYKHGDETCYQPPRAVIDRDQPVDALICVSPTGEASVVTVTAPESRYPLKKPIRFERTTFVDKTAPTFQQELVYNGRAGSIVKFLYREFMSESARPPFSQDVQYDLREGNVVGFKSARLEIISATNTTITYRVLAHFPPPPMM